MIVQNYGFVIQQHQVASIPQICNMHTTKSYCEFVYLIISLNKKLLMQNEYDC